MPLSRAAVTQCRLQVLDGSLVPTLIEQYRHQLSRRPSPAEIRSWERSLHRLSADLVQAGLDQVEVLVEYQLPLTSKRADVVLCGLHPRTNQPSYVVVELKQWSEATLLEDSISEDPKGEDLGTGCRVVGEIELRVQELPARIREGSG